MRVAEICTRDPVTVRKSERLTEAAKRMREAHVGDLVVVETYGPRVVPVGILTDRDIVIEVVARVPDRMTSLEVGDVIGDDVLTVCEDEDLTFALERMRKFSVRRIPVVD